MSKAAEQVYRTLETVTRHLPGVGEGRRPALTHLALRLSLHPDLRPYLHDPLLPLGGGFVSLDAQLAGLTDFAAAHGLSGWLGECLPHGDGESLAAVTGAAFRPGPASPPGHGFSAPGVLAGALYVPSRHRASWCRVVAAPLPGRPPSPRWPAPVCVRPLGAEVAASAGAALRAAMAVLEEAGTYPEDLAPGTLLFDVCAPDLPDAVLAAAAGNSLGLPLCLAFLSALLNRPPVAGIAATGAVGAYGGPPEAVCPVGHVSDKANAVYQAGFTALLAPEAVAGAEPVADAPTAAVRLLPGWRDALARPVVYGGAAAAVFAAFRLPEGGREESAAVARRILRRVLEGSGGDTGDAGGGLEASLPDAITAARAAVGVHQALLCHPWPEGEAPVAVAAGLAPSPVEAERLAAAAQPGQTLLPANLVALLGPLPPGWQANGLGALRLHDLQPPVALAALVIPGLPRRAAARPRALDPARHNLPVVAGDCVGREADIGQIHRLLGAHGARLVTLTGVPGVGKTRLALEAAVRRYDDFPGGVWFAPLHEAKAPEDVPIAVAEAMRLPLPPAETEAPAAAVLRALAGRRALLVLDNGETAPAGTSFLSELLRAAPEVVCLVTARTPLRVKGEDVLPVVPLAVPMPEAGDSLDAPAARLFLACAGAAGRGFAEPGPAERAAVAGICRRLGGLPLALEVAAAQARYRTLPEIERHLADSVPLPAGGGVAAEARTLRQTLEWSYALLDPEEQAALRRLSVFAGGGGFTFDAALAVVGAGGSGGPGGDPFAQEHLLGLIEKVLVQRRPDAGDERYTLLPLVRDLAAARLAGDGEGAVAAARDAHAAYYTDLLCARTDGLDADAGAAALDGLDAELPQLRAAFSHLSQTGGARLPKFVQCAAEFLRRRGHQREWAAWPRIALRLLEEKVVEATPAEWSRLHHHRAAAHRYAGRFEEAREHAREAVAWGRRALRRNALADALVLAGLVELSDGRHDAAHEAFVEAREVFRSIPLARGEVTALTNLANLAHDRKDFAGSRARFEEVAGLCRRIDDRHGLMLAVGNLGALSFGQGDMAAARRSFEEAVSLALDQRAARELPLFLMNLGETLARSGETAAGMRLLVHAEQILLKMEHRFAREAAALVAEFSPALGDQEGVAALRRELGRRTLAALLRTDPRSARAVSLPYAVLSLPEARGEDGPEGDTLPPAD